MPAAVPACRAQRTHLRHPAQIRLQFQRSSLWAGIAMSVSTCPKVPRAANRNIGRAAVVHCGSPLRPSGFASRRDSSYSVKSTRGVVMANAVKQAKTEKISRKTRHFGWLWPLGVAATSVAGVAMVALRGCWHRRMSWPVRMQEHSYQVCLDCGVKRLFDEKRFCSYGPFRYDLNELIAWETARRPEAMPAPRAHRPAS